jgi:micrococcal nuclease
VQQLLRFSVTAMAFSAIVGPIGERSDRVAVRYVLDGDTFEAERVGRVRLLGIDAPEIGRSLETSEPFAHEARERLAALVTARWVRLEHDGPRRDVYQRRLAYVFLENGTFVNAVLVRDGLARVSAGRSLARLIELRRAERDAQLFRRGMWGERPSLPLERYVLPRARPGQRPR